MLRFESRKCRCRDGATGAYSRELGALSGHGAGRVVNCRVVCEVGACSSAVWCLGFWSVAREIRKRYGKDDAVYGGDRGL